MALVGVDLHKTVRGTECDIYKSQRVELRGVRG